jgi:hypothetical protein
VYDANKLHDDHVAVSFKNIQVFNYLAALHKLQQTNGSVVVVEEEAD